MILIALLLLLLPGPLGESIFLEEDCDDESGMLIFELVTGAKLIFGVRIRLAEESIYVWFFYCFWRDVDEYEEGR